MPAARRLLADQVDMQFADLRALLRLPQDAVAPNVGCNLTATAMICAQISGFSIWFFHNRHAKRISGLEKKKNRGRPYSGRRFKAFVRAYYPLVVGEPSVGLIADRLYEARNVLAHSLGVGDMSNNRQRQIYLAKPDPPLAAADIVDLETQAFYPLAGVPIRRTGLRMEFSVPGLYWALGRMLRKALEDQPQRCEDYAAEIVGRMPVPRHG